MNLILLFEQDFVHDGLVALSGRRLTHLRTVHKANPGDTLRVGKINGLIGEGTVQRIDSSSCVMNVVFDKNPPPPLECTLFLALPRPKALLRIVENATAMGIKRIYVMESWRVEKGFWNSPSLSKEEITEHCVLGLEQARDTVMPEIQFRRRFKPFVEDEVPSLVKSSTPLVAHPGAIAPCPREHPGHITLAVGPEGGFISYEIELLQTHGFTAVHFGPRILRTEWFVSAAIAKLF